MDISTRLTTKKKFQPTLEHFFSERSADAPSGMSDFDRRTPKPVASIDNDGASAQPEVLNDEDASMKSAGDFDQTETQEISQPGSSSLSSMPRRLSADIDDDRDLRDYQKHMMDLRDSEREDVSDLSYIDADDTDSWTASANCFHTGTQEEFQDMRSDDLMTGPYLRQQPHEVDDAVPSTSKGVVHRSRDMTLGLRRPAVIDGCKHLMLDEQLLPWIRLAGAQVTKQKITAKTTVPLMQKHVNNLKDIYINCLEKVVFAFEAIPKNLIERLPGFDSGTFWQLQSLRQRVKAKLDLAEDLPKKKQHDSCPQLEKDGEGDSTTAQAVVAQGMLKNDAIESPTSQPVPQNIVPRVSTFKFKRPTFGTSTLNSGHTMDSHSTHVPDSISSHAGKTQSAVPSTDEWKDRASSSSSLSPVISCQTSEIAQVPSPAQLPALLTLPTTQDAIIPSPTKRTSPISSSVSLMAPDPAPARQVATATQATRVLSSTSLHIAGLSLAKKASLVSSPKSGTATISSPASHAATVASPPRRSDQISSSAGHSGQSVAIRALVTSPQGGEKFFDVSSMQWKQIDSSESSTTGHNTTPPEDLHTSQAAAEPGDGVSCFQGDVKNGDDKWKFAGIHYDHYHEMMRVLRDTFCHYDFQPNQMEAINAVLLGHDCLILMPIGGGKSLCYQLPAVISSGVTVVVLPLMSLIIQQVEMLRFRDVPAAHMVGIAKDYLGRDIYPELPPLEPGLKLLYVTPDQLTSNSDLLDALCDLDDRQQLARFVIEEAHSVSKWGHEFRPDHEALTLLREHFPRVPLMALTAVATRRVRADIPQQLRMKDPKFFVGSFNRPNIKYSVIPKMGNAVTKQIIMLVKAKFARQSGIVYCRYHDECDKVASELNAEGIKAVSYHQGIEESQRSAVQEQWVFNRAQVICATIEFGIGISKSDVRFVLHHFLPKSMEAYYQGSGQAGLDGNLAYCILCYNYLDSYRLRVIIELDRKTKAYSTLHQNKLRYMVAYCENRTDCRRVQQLKYFGEVNFKQKCVKQAPTACDNCITQDHYNILDVTKVCQAIVRCVAVLECQANYTLGYINQIFLARDCKKIKDLGHDKLQLHGIGRHWQHNDAACLMRRMVLNGFIREVMAISRQHVGPPYVRLGPRANDLLAGRCMVTFPVKGNALPDPVPTSDSDGDGLGCDEVMAPSTPENTAETEDNSRDDSEAQLREEFLEDPEPYNAESMVSARRSEAAAGPDASPGDDFGDWRDEPSTSHSQTRRSRSRKRKSIRQRSREIKRRKRNRAKRR